MRRIDFSKLSKFNLVVSFFVLAHFSTAWAITPATSAQVLCAYDNVVEATVVQASLSKCHAYDDTGNCTYPANSIDLVVEIDDVIASKGSTKIAGAIAHTPRIGDVYLGKVGDQIPLPESVARAREDEIAKRILEHRYPPSKSEQELTKKADIRDYFIGKKFIFGLIFMDRNPMTFSSVAWLPNSRSWIVDELQKEHANTCARLP